MTRTFEEMASGELDALYQGALFLSGGSASEAEALLVDSVTLAFDEHARDTDVAAVERGLEARLVRSFLHRVKGEVRPLPAGTADRLELDPSAFDDLGADELFGAAAMLPPLPRAALWLVLLRRWSYRDAAEALGISHDEMPRLLGYRDVLIREMLGSPRGGSRRKETG